jgi:hypothetical protein
MNKMKVPFQEATTHVEMDLLLLPHKTEDIRLLQRKRNPIEELHPS